jgi:ATP-dependent exoDNAse (exonuclease V) alpha subunit
MVLFVSLCIFFSCNRGFVGSVLLIDGDWKIDTKYGRQFNARKWEETMPASICGMEKYLGSGLIKGSGPKFARKIVQKYGFLQEHGVSTSFAAKIYKAYGNESILILFPDRKKGFKQQNNSLCDNRILEIIYKINTI